MRAKTSLAILVPLTMFCLGLVLWMGGCDFTRVDEGADVALEDHLALLASATTQEAAESAIRGILNKTEVGVRWRLELKPGEYDAYTLSDDQFKALAKAQSGFVSGDQSLGKTISQVYDNVLAADADVRKTADDPDVGISAGVRAPIVVSLTELSMIFQASAKAAQKNPQEPANALLLTIAAEGASLPEPVRRFSADHILSPVQQFFLQIWFHRNGPFMASFLSGVGVEAGKTNSADNTPCCGEAPSKFTTLTLQYTGASSASVDVDIVGSMAVDNVFESSLQPDDIFTISGIGLDRGNPGFNGTIGNEVAINVGGVENTRIHTSCSTAVLPGDIYGDFMVIAVTTKTGGFCGNLETCIGACQAQLNTCISTASTPEEIEACRVQYRDCDQGCHDQGGGGTP
ncbi:MAG TPA: hypothetical protein VKP65_23315 [Rhodothermales bacterium]|nr:hypothetical protein [Rhodothermales bacterium]